MSGRQRSVVLIVAACLLGVLVCLLGGSLWWARMSPNPQADVVQPVSNTDAPGDDARVPTSVRQPAVNRGAATPSLAANPADAPWWKLGQVCDAEPSRGVAPVPDVFSEGTPQHRLMAALLSGRLTDELIDVAIAGELTLETLPDDAPIEDVYVAAAIEVNELTRVRWQCTQQMADDHFVSTGEHFTGGEQLRPCMEPERPTSLLNVLDEIATTAEDPWLRGHASLLAVDALRQVGLEEAHLEVNDRVYDVILSADDTATIGQAMANIDVRGLVDADDWPQLQQVVVGNPELAPIWLGVVLPQLVFAERTEEASRWWAAARDCYDEGCVEPMDASQRSRCDDVEALIRHYGH